MKILAFAASNHSNSINKQLVSYISSKFEGHDVELLDINDYEMPIYSIDREVSGGVPKLAEDFAAKINPELIFTDCLHRTRLLARNRNINYCVVRITLVIYTATNTSVVVYLSLTVFLEVYRIFRTIGVAAAGYATLTEIGYFVVYLHARRARLVYDA